MNQSTIKTIYWKRYIQIVNSKTKTVNDVWNLYMYNRKHSVELFLLNEARVA